MDNTISNTFRRKAGLIAVIVIALHILLCIFAMFAPKSWVHAVRVTSLYDRLVILGPFFQEGRIKSTPHVIVSYKHHHSWTPWIDHSSENFSYFKQHPWRYDKLHESDLERNAAFRLNRSPADFRTIKNTRAFRELNALIQNEYDTNSPDSIRVAYGFNVYNLSLKAFHFDTLFRYTYAPSDVQPPKTNR